MASEIRHVREERGAAQDNRSLGELFSELSRESTTLIRQEVALAKTELSHKVAHLGKDAGFIAAGGLVAYAGLLSLVAAVVLWLWYAGMNAAWAALLVGLVVLAIGAGLAWSGIQHMRTADMMPRQTIETLKEDTQWAKEQTK